MTQRTLIHTLRPRKLSQLVGQEQLVSSIQEQFKKKREPAAWMFIGPTGNGKTTVARILAVSLQCPHGPIGEPCDECWANRNSFGIREINASDISGVEQMREVASLAEYSPIPPTKKNVFLLDEAQRLSTAAQNLLLKPFEDAPMTTVWIVCTTEPHKILETLKRRCRILELKPLTAEQIEQLVKRGLASIKSSKKPTPLVNALWEAKIQYPGHILGAIENYDSGMKSTEAVKNLTNQIDVSSICTSMEKGDWNVVREQTEKATADDLRGIRAAIAGYLRKMLENKIISPRATEIATAIEKVAKVDSYTDVTQGPATVGVLYELCRLFQNPVAAKMDDDEEDSYEKRVGNDD